MYTSCLIICANLKEIPQKVNEELMPQDLISEINNSGKNGRRKKFFLYDHLHILLDHLCKFERNPPYSLGGVDATRFYNWNKQRAITLVKMVAGKNPFFTIIYSSCLIICANLKEIPQKVNKGLMPQDLISENNKGL